MKTRLSPSRRLDVKTDGVIAPDQLRRWAGVKLDENLLALDLARVKRDLELVPVDPVCFGRARPAAHAAHPRNRARAHRADQRVPRPARRPARSWWCYQVDADGWVMLPLDPRQRAVPLDNQPRRPLPVIDRRWTPPRCSPAGESRFRRSRRRCS